MNGRGLSVREIQEVELRMLDFLDEACNEAGVEYCLAYGSALGAYRHGGFIPWDDDMDVYVKAEDCARLFDLIDAKGKGRYAVLRPCESRGYRHPYAKLVDLRTTLVEPKNAPVEGMGVFIDLFPCHFYSKGGPGVAVRARIANLLNKAYCQAFVRGGEDAPAALLRFRRLLANSGCARWAHESIERLIRFGARDAGEYAACPYDAGYVLRTNVVFPSRKLEFEGRSIPAPGMIEDYLRSMYGPDYMVPARTESANHGVARWRASEIEKRS